MDVPPSHVYRFASDGQLFDRLGRFTEHGAEHTVAVFSLPDIKRW